MIFNTELFHKKSVLVICFIFVMGPIYVKLLNIIQKSSGLSLFKIGAGLLVTLLILYIIKCLSVIIEYLLLKGFTEMKMKYNIIYPFAIDDKISFKPLVLLMNPESIRDIIPLNLVHFIKGEQADETVLKEKFRTLLRINTIADMGAYLLAFYAANIIFQHNFLLVFLISFIAVYLQKSLSDGAIWKGLKYIYNEDSISKYIYSFPNIEELEAIDYAKYLESNQGTLDMETVHIMENYLLESINTKSSHLDCDKLDEILMKWYEKTNNNKYVVLHIVGVFNVIKLIGLLSLKTNNSEYLSLFNKHIDIIVKQYSKSENEYDFLKPYMDFVNGKTDKISIYHNFDSNRKTIFSYRTQLERSIFVKS